MIDAGYRVLRMRLFVAIYPSEEALDQLAAAVTGLRLGAATAAGKTVGLTARERWHVTLAFLGEVPEESVAAAGAAVYDAVTRWRANGGQAPALRLAGGGRFGRRRFTVLWVGVTGDVDGLRALSTAVRRALRRHDLPCDGKPLRPHLTLARPGERLPDSDLTADIQALAAYQGPGWTLDAVHLMRSHLGPRPVHEPVATVPLA